MESEIVKKIKELIDCDKKQNELGGIIVVNRQFLIEIINLINELENENERLNKNNYRLLERNRDLTRACDTCRISLKQFAERLKEKCNDKNAFICSNSITATEIDETLKEFING